MKFQSLSAHPHTDGSFLKTFLKLHSKTELKHSPKQVDGDLF